MNKVDYLANQVVASFVRYVARLLTGEIAVDEIWPGFESKFGLIPDKTLEQIFRGYKWREKDFRATTEELKPLRRALRQALRDPEKLNADTLWARLKACITWGMGKTDSHEKWALEQAEMLVPIFMAGVAALDSDSPDLTTFDVTKMNAGYTKPFSLAADHSIMMDGRVGAALCLLVRQFLREHPEFAANGVPEVLGFRWGAQHTWREQQPIPRNPSGDGLKFSKLSGSRRWAELNIRANWILSAARDLAGTKWCRGRFALRHIEAALFMLGYRIDPPMERCSDRIVAQPVPSANPASQERGILPVLTTFEHAYATLLRQPGATIALHTRSNTPYTATAGTTRDGRTMIEFPHNNRAYSTDWGHTHNSYGMIGQRIAQYVAPLDAWVASQAT